MRLDLMLRTIQFVLAQFSSRNGIELVVDARLKFLDGMLSTGFRPDMEDRWIFRFAILGGDKRHRLLTLY